MIVTIGNGPVPEVPDSVAYGLVHETRRPFATAASTPRPTKAAMTANIAAGRGTLDTAGTGKRGRSNTSAKGGGAG